MSAASLKNSLPPPTRPPCCYQSAMEESATWCGECGKPIIRCMAFEECGGLLDDSGLCTVCVAPHLQIEAGAIQAAHVGGAVALPITVANLSVVGRPLFVTSLHIREGRDEWAEQALGWEQLQAGEQRPVTIRADAFDRAGVHNIECLISVASRWRWREERFAFSTTLTFDVQEQKSKSGPVVNVGGESAGHGNTVYIAGQNDSDKPMLRSDEALDLRLVRAEKEERRFGLRGNSAELYVPRNVPLEWTGFSDVDVPMNGPLLTSDGILGVGRSRSRKEGGLGDVRILPELPGGEIDEDLARQISRRHFELYVENDRLVLRVTGGGGLRVNGDAYGRDKTVTLSDGDVISLLVQSEQNLKLVVRFQAHHGRVSRVTIAREPASSKSES